MVLGGTGSEQGGTGCQHNELSENIWFTCCKPSNYPIIGEGKSDYGQTDTQTDTQTDRQTKTDRHKDRQGETERDRDVESMRTWWINSESDRKI